MQTLIAQKMPKVIAPEPVVVTYEPIPDYTGRMNKDPKQLLSLVCEIVGVTDYDVQFSGTRHVRATAARRLFAWALRRYTVKSYPEVASWVRPHCICHSSTIGMVKKAVEFNNAADPAWLNIARPLVEKVESTGTVA